MAIVDSLDGVLHEIHKARVQVPFNVTRDGLVEQLISDSPINFGSWLRDELEYDQNAAFSVFASSEETKEKPGTKRMKVHTFELPDTSKAPVDQSQYFTRVAISKADNKHSMLTDLLKAAPKNPQPTPSQGGRTLKLNIFFPTMESVVITVDSTATVLDLIKTALTSYEMQCKDSKKPIRISLNPNYYVLRFAEDDGAPDEDMPALVKTQEIGQFKGSFNFCLCRDTSFTDDKPNSGVARALFKVYLPKNGGFVSVAYQKDMKLKDIKETVCRKRALEGEFHFENDAGNHLPNDLTLGELSLPSVKLVAGKFSKHQRQRSNPLISIKGLRKSSSNSDLGDAPKQVTKRLGPIFFNTDVEAAKYKSFPVIKYNKYGKAQERIMGIDEKKIYNGLPEGKVTKSNKTKRPERAIADVVLVQLNPIKSDQFFVQFKDKTYKYESAHAEEIVAKLSHLLKMNEEERARKHRTG